MFIKSNSEGDSSIGSLLSVLLFPQIPSPEKRTFFTLSITIVFELINVSCTESFACCLSLCLLVLFSLISILLLVPKNPSTVSINSPKISLLFSFFFFLFAAKSESFLPNRASVVGKSFKNLSLFSLNDFSPSSAILLTASILDLILDFWSLILDAIIIYSYFLLYYHHRY